MKNLLSTFVLLSLGLGAVATANTGDVDPGVRVPTTPGIHGANRVGESVLVVRDYLPWGGDVVPFFVDANTVVTEINSDMVAGTVLDDFCMVFVTTGTAQIGDAIETNMNAVEPQLTAYVAGGGVVLYETGTWGAQLVLPGGVTNVWDYQVDNFFTGPNYLATGMPYPTFSGNYASHDNFAGLPGGADILITDAAGAPTAARYQIGAGSVLALSQPIECYIPGGGCYPSYPHFNQLQANAIELARYYGDCGDPVVVSAEDQATSFELQGNYPNPFNPTTTIAFSVAETMPVELSVFSLTGERVATLVDGLTEAGAHEVVFDAAALPSGLYFSRLQAAGQVQTERMLLVK